MNKIIGIVIMVAGITVLFVMYQERDALLGLNNIPRILNVPERTVQIPGTHPATGVSVSRTSSGSVISGGKSAVKAVPATKRVTAPSPKPVSYAEKVRITNVLRTEYPRPHEEVTLSSAADIYIDITGWKIKSKTDSITVPKALRYYAPLYEPSNAADIVLRPNDRVTLYSDASAVGANFQLNKCFGYVAAVNNFSPSLPIACPSINYASLRYFSGECQNYIETLSACRVPPPIPPIPYDPQCNAFLQTLNYQSCYNAHKLDSDFLSNDIRVWLGDSIGNQRIIFDQYHDVVQLVTPGGEVVDEYNY